MASGPALGPNSLKAFMHSNIIGKASAPPPPVTTNNLSFTWSSLRISF